MKTKIISALLAGTILSSSVQAPAMTVNNPRIATYIGYAGGALAGAIIGYKISSNKDMPTSKTSTLSTMERLKAFINKRYPVAVGCILGAILGASTGFGVELYWTALTAGKSRNALQITQNIQAELNQRKQEICNAYFVRKEIDFDLFTFLNNELAKNSADFNNYNQVQRTARELQAYKNNLKNLESQINLAINSSKKYLNPFSRLPHEAFKNGECSICLTNQKTIRTEFCPCSMAENKQSACDNCLNQWLTAHNTCPFCQGTM